MESEGVPKVGHPDHHMFAKMPDRRSGGEDAGCLQKLHVIVNWRPWCSTSEAPAILNRWNVPPTRRRAPPDNAHKLL